MVAKFFKSVAIILVRISGIIFALISILMLYKSIGFCGNLIDILSVDVQLGLSVWRLLGIFLLNLIGLIFDWCIALTIFILSISMVLYKTKALDKISEMKI